MHISAIILSSCLVKGVEAGFVNGMGRYPFVE
jgi:hypothetical protein